MTPRRRNTSDDSARQPSRWASTRDLLDRPLPHNVEAEQTVLASLLLDPTRLAEVRPLLRPDAFFDARHVRLYTEMLDLTAAGQPIDFEVLAHRLKAAGALKAIGGVAYLAEVAEAVPTALHAAAHAKIVADLYGQRRIIAAGVKLLQLGHDDLHAARNVDALAAEALEVVRNATEGAGPISRGAKPVVLNMADVVAERIEWLWPGRIALGMMTLVAGDPGLGKSFLSCDLAARVSLGSSWPDDVLTEAPRGGVVMLNAEDDVAKVVRPRLDKAGADVARINFVQAVRDEGAEYERQLDLSRDLAALEAAILQTPDCKLAIIDPLSSYVGRIDAHRSNDVRAVVDPLAKLAARHNIALLCVTHLNKGGNGGGPAIYRATGSLSFIAAARAGFYVSRDKDRPDRRLLLPAKNNLAVDTLGMAYAIVDGCLAWETEPVRMTADDAMQQSAGPGEDRGERRESVDWLRDVLAGGPVPAKDLQRLALDAGLSWPAVKRAKEELGIPSHRQGFGKGSTCTWALPERTDDRASPIGRIESKPGALNSMDSMNPMADDEVQTWSA